MRRPGRGVPAALAALVALGAASPALADCTISATPVAFGTYNVFSPVPVDSTGSVTYRCAKPKVPVLITLDRGGAPSFIPRVLRNMTEVLTYNLYLDAGRTLVWGDGTGGTRVYTNTPQNANPIRVTIHGRVPAQQDVGAGAYADSVTATIQF